LPVALIATAFDRLGDEGAVDALATISIDDGHFLDLGAVIIRSDDLHVSHQHERGVDMVDERTAGKKSVAECRRC
jgi:hypothetical protein